MMTSAINKLIKLAIWMVLLNQSLEPVEGLKCYVCEDCIVDGPQAFDCEQFYKIGTLTEDEKEVCFKEGGGSGSVIIRKGCKVAKKPTLGCVKPDANGKKSFVDSSCLCDEDKCNAGKTVHLDPVILVTLGVTFVISQGWYQCG